MPQELLRHPFAIELRDPIRLEAFSVMARVSRHAVYAADFPATQEAFWILFHDMHSALRANRPEWLYNDRLHIDFPDRTEVRTIDLRNTQFMGADHGVSSFKGGYEPDIMACVEAFVPHDGVLIDVGANWGYYPLYLACRPGFCGRVLAFEPFPNSFRDLTQLVKELGLRQIITPYPLAAGDRSGIMEITSEVFSGNNRTVSDGSGTTIYQERLDHIVTAADLGRIDLIKIDVEGAEPAVLRGAAGCIQRFRPAIIFESWKSDPASTIEPFEVLLEIAPAYRFYAIEGEVAPQPEHKKSLLSGELVEITAADRISKEERINVLALPADRDPKAAFPERA